MLKHVFDITVTKLPVKTYSVSPRNDSGQKDAGNPTTEIELKGRVKVAIVWLKPFGIIGKNRGRITHFGEGSARLGRREADCASDGG